MPLSDTLFLTDTVESKDAYRALISETTQAILEAVTNNRAYCGPTPDSLKNLIHVDEMLPAKGLGWSVVLDRLKKQILPNFLRTFSTDYMAHLHSAAMIESLASELIISAFNQSMDSWDQSPVATEIELEVIRELCTLYGYSTKTTDGTFTSGGSQSNETAIILARDWFCNKHLNYDVKKYGLPPNFRKFRLYTSCISHFSMEKSAHILGLGYECVVKVPVDSHKKMDTAELRRLVETDLKSGYMPFCVVATVGTTDFGSIDPIIEINDICRGHGMWLHADAAYGSGVILSQKYKNRVANLNLCDSITVDFHKMFMQPISCSAVLVKDGRNFEALTIHADYLNRTEDEEDGYTNLVDKSIQTTRRFDALKVWVSFQTRGQDGWSQLITTCMDNATYLYTALKADSAFEVVTSPEISSVVFRLSPSFCEASNIATNSQKAVTNSQKALANTENTATTDDVNRRVRRALIHEHGVVIGQTVSDGNVCLKFTLLNPLVTHQKLDELLTLIKSLSKA